MTDAQLVDRWLEQHGAPRRFPRGASGEPAFMAEYLRAKGIEFKSGKWSMRGQRSLVVEQCGQRRTMTRENFLYFVDQLRIADGLEPIVRRK